MSITSSIKTAWKQVWSSAGRREVLILLFLILLALLPRLYRLGAIPAGLNGDEIFNAIDALGLGSGNWPIFFAGNNGREAFFLYLMSGSLNLFGQTTWAIRLPSVLLGTGSVLLAYAIGRHEFSRRVGLLAALLMAVSLWPLMRSRLAYRAISLTFFTALTVYLYALALRREKNSALLWIAAGIALGLTMYTYIPSRVFPLVILGWFTWIALTNRPLIYQKWRYIALSLLVALIIFAPYGLYMIQNPELVNQRIYGLAGGDTLDIVTGLEAGKLVENIIFVLLMFAVRGDTSLRYHAAARPVFDPLTGFFFYLGLATTLWLAFKKDSQPNRRASHGLLLLWFGAMLAPVVFTGAGISFLRAAGAIVPTYLIAAIGIDAVYTWLRRKWPARDRLWRLGLVALVSVGLVLTLFTTWRAYSDGWANDPEASKMYHSDLAEIGHYLDENPPAADTSVFVLYDYVAETTPFAFTYYSDQQPTWFQHNKGLSWRPSAVEATYFESVSKPLNEAIVAKLTAVAEVQTINFENGEPAFNVYRVDPARLDWDPLYPAEIQFVDGPTFIGIDMPDELYQGETIPLTLHWQVPSNQSPLPNRLTYAQLFLQDESGNRWVQDESLLGYPEAGWQSGDRFVHLTSIDIPAGIPPRPLYLRFGLRDFDGTQYSALASDKDRIGPFLVRSRPVDEIVLEADTPVFDQTLALQGSAFSTLLVPGQPIDISLDWLALESPPDDYRVEFVLILPGSEEPLLTQTSELWPDVYPPSSWQKGERVTTFHRLEIPRDIPVDVNPLLKLHLLTSDSDEPLPLTQGENTLAELTPLVRDHIFETPAITHQLEAQFGQDIRLLGYDLDASNSRPNGELTLTLYWQALNSPSDDYTVFNHLVATDGQIEGQFDGLPVGDAWLTSMWLSGEIIIDRRIIPIRPGAKAGEHSLNIGLYKASNGQRLPVFVGNQPQANDQLTLTPVTITP